MTGNIVTRFGFLKDRFLNFADIHDLLAAGLKPATRWGIYGLRDFTPDMGNYLDIENKGWFFGVYVLSTILIRFFGSGISDKIGRRKTLIGGMTMLIISMSTVAFSNSIEMYTTGAVLFGIATGISSPTLFAWTADLSKPERRGVGSGTLFIALEFGILLGSASTLVTYDNSISSVPVVFLFGSLLAAIAVLYLFWHLRFRHSNT